MGEKLYPLLMFLAKAEVKYRIEAVNVCIPLPDKPIIYAANHSAFCDIPIALRVIGRHTYPFVGKQNMGILDKIFLALNGTIWVDRQNRESRAEAKTTIIKYLVKGCSVLWFPEATWNLTANLLMLPMRWGIIEVAHRAEAQIIPMALEYDRNKRTCCVKFGNPMTGEVLADKAKGIRLLRDELATLRWDLMCNNDVLHREQLDVMQLKSEVESAIDEYPPLDWEYETTCIYQEGR